MEYVSTAVPACGVKKAIISSTAVPFVCESILIYLGVALTPLNPP